MKVTRKTTIASAVFGMLAGMAVQASAETVTSVTADAVTEKTQRTVSIADLDLTSPTAVILGSEGWGIRKVTADRCDHLINIPMARTVDCLNVSVAAGVILYETVRQRLSNVEQ